MFCYIIKKYKDKISYLCFKMYEAGVFKRTVGKILVLHMALAAMKLV